MKAGRSRFITQPCKPGNNLSLWLTPAILSCYLIWSFSTQFFKIRSKLHRYSIKQCRELLNYLNYFLHWHTASFARSVRISPVSRNVSPQDKNLYLETVRFWDEIQYQWRYQHLVILSHNVHFEVKDRCIFVFIFPLFGSRRKTFKAPKLQQTQALYISKETNLEFTPYCNWNALYPFYIFTLW